MTASPSPLSLPTANRRETVVLLHASASSARQWDALAELLRPHFEVHALELHGHGRGPACVPGRPFSLHDDAALARALLERAGGGHVIGHSYGGAVALHLAAGSPALVHSLAVYEPVLPRLLDEHAPRSPGRQEAFAMSAYVRQCVDQGRDDDAARYFVDYWSGAHTWSHMSPTRQQAIASRMPLIAQHFDTLIAEPLALSALCRGMPLLCLHGARTTRSMLHVAALLRCLLPHARHEALDGLPHMGPLSHPAPVNERLLRFLHFDVPCRAPHPAPAAADDPCESAETADALA